jgi:hypothetical protein
MRNGRAAVKLRCFESKNLRKDRLKKEIWPGVQGSAAACYIFPALKAKITLQTRLKDDHFELLLQMYALFFIQPIFGSKFFLKNPERVNNTLKTGG